MKRSNARSFALFAAVVLAMPVFAPSVARAEADSVGLVIVAMNGEPLLNAVARQAARSETYRDRVRKWVLRLPDGGASADRPLPGSDFSPREAREWFSSAATPAAGSYDDPNSWPVQGRKQGDGSYWIANPMAWAERHKCSLFSCSITDRAEVKATITPTRLKTGSKKSKGTPVNGILWHSKSSGNFSGMHIDVWGITNYRVMYKSAPGTVQLANGQSKKAYARNDVDLARNRLTVAVQFWVLSDGNWHATGGKTADCIGRAGSDRRCFY